MLFVLFSEPTFTVQTGPGKSSPATFHVSHNYVTFRVRGCEEALIHMSSSDHNDNGGYNITLGAANNTLILITDIATSEITEFPGPDLLECNTLRPFWITWTSGEITIGRGEYLSHLLYTYRPPSTVNIQFITFSSPNAEDIVTWEFPKAISK